VKTAGRDRPRLSDPQAQSRTLDTICRVRADYHGDQREFVHCCWLRERGHEAEHVKDVGSRGGRDGTIIVAKDEDFAARSRRAAG